VTSSGINTRVPPSGTGCADCGAAEPPGWWLHLRRCAECGHIGCCDTSPAQHATAHARATGHRYIQSFEPGEDWYYDYETQDMLEGPTLVAPVAHPDDQPAPGPAGRVPSDWMRRIHN
jgi:hypothetical protein